MKYKTTWILVADGARANFFAAKALVLALKPHCLSRWLRKIDQLEKLSVIAQAGFLTLRARVATLFNPPQISIVFLKKSLPRKLPPFWTSK